ncbi:hypothetical protein FAZ15_01475 [Sphingobacterium olei]|uniref:RHS repeat protein n=1 Tax=Sphingobacterium olei TaxID=2571155 RepID=A0A4U0P6D6_9SPHI|nr:hypothetical protein [Sphingobacterium olei]TJZ62995.1 hypothetical protein FAZ15_01475 [Sphingobacterium olei]
MNKTFYVLVILMSTLLLRKTCFSQDADKVRIFRPIPQSPRISALSKYINYPTGEASGVPAIDIPLFEIKIRDKVIPITLSYHASGIKVAEKETEVGLGWSIRGIGTIARCFGSVLDESAANGNFASPSYTFEQLLSKRNETDANARTQNFHELRDIINRTGKDMNADLFFYSTGRESGAFYRNGVPFFQMPFREMIINNTIPDLNGKFNFNISGDKLSYAFTSYSTISSTYIENVYGEDPIEAWHLTSIRTADDIRQVHIEYEPREIQELVYYQEQCIGKDFLFGTPTVGTQALSSSVKTFTDTITHLEQRVKKITTNDYTANFVYAAESGLLVHIIIRNPFTNEQVKLINFYYNDNDPDRDRTKLLALEFMSPTALELTERYSFQYSSRLLPDLSTGNGRHAQDVWGYFNNKSNTGLITSRTINGSALSLTGMTASDLATVHTIGNADRASSAEDMQAGILTSITSPYGGFEIFDYEQNKWEEQGTNIVKHGAGLRIKLIKKYDRDSTLLNETLYKYGKNEDGLGTFLQDESLSLKDYAAQSLYTYQNSAGASCSGNLDSWQAKFFGIGNFQAAYLQGMSIFYGHVTRYTGLNNTLAKTATIYDKDSTLNNVNTAIMNNTNYGIFNPVLTNINKLQEIIYGMDGPTTYKPIRKTLFNREKFFNQIDTLSFIYELKRFVEPPPSFCSGYTIGSSHMQQFGIYGYRYMGQISRAISETEITYGTSNLDSVVKVRNFEYGNLHPLYVKKIIETNVNGYSVEKWIDYIADVVNANSLGGTVLSNDELAAYLSMKNRGERWIPIQETILRNGTRMSMRRTLYKNWGGGLVMPQRIAEVKRTGAWENEFIFLKYDEVGNVLESKSRASLPTSFIVDTLGDHQLAVAQNATYNDIAFTSFETANHGNWSMHITPSIVDDFFAPTGSKVLSAANNKIIKAGLTPSKTYILSYWAKGTSAATVSGGAALLLQSRNGWQFYRRTISGVSQIELNSSLSDVFLDDLRLYPEGSFFTTYTYDKQGNISSMTDPAERITYYKFDWKGRMRLILDQNGHITTSICYNAAGQMIDCGQENGTAPGIDEQVEEDEEPYPQPPCPPPSVYETFYYATSSAAVCSQSSSLQVRALYFNPADSKYYSNCTYTLIPATGYYRGVSSTTYKYIVNGVQQATGSCLPPL